MIQVPNIRVHVDQLPSSDSTLASEISLLKTKVSQLLHIKVDDIARLELRRRSIDARKRHDVVLMYTVAIELTGGPTAEAAILAHPKSKATTPSQKRWQMPVVAGASNGAHHSTLSERPVVVGAGCAGLFCALVLARAGLSPLLIERGDNAARRSSQVELHNQMGVLDPESNIQFGLGGAGTFSDGKLNTGTKALSHRFILETFVEAGAPANILWDAKPHVGSDILPDIVTKMVAMIEEAGGEVRFRSKMTDLLIDQHQVTGIEVTQRDPETHEERVEVIPTHHVMLASGHSARDVFELLKERAVSMERKTFAMGVRIEHPQSLINRALHGRFADHAALGAASYKLADHLPHSRSAFSFCMCPGGYVVSAASEENQVCTNGMSYSDRAGHNANAGLLVNVFPDDLPGSDVLEGIELQRSCEKKAFELGGGAYVAPAQLVGDFLKKQASSAAGSVEPTYPRGVTWTSLESALPSYITDTLRQTLPRMGQRLYGYDLPDAVLTGVETRSSSPIRVTRTDQGESVNTRGLFPVGEGAGYAGGIMSAAADGIATAEKLIALLNNH